MKLDERSESPSVGLGVGGANLALLYFLFPSPSHKKKYSDSWAFKCYLQKSYTSHYVALGDAAYKLRSVLFHVGADLTLSSSQFTTLLLLLLFRPE